MSRISLEQKHLHDDVLYVFKTHYICDFKKKCISDQGELMFIVVIINNIVVILQVFFLCDVSAVCNTWSPKEFLY